MPSCADVIINIVSPLHLTVLISLPIRVHTLIFTRERGGVLADSAKYTVFAPSNEAFAKLNPVILERIQTSGAYLRGTCTSHFLGHFRRLGVIHDDNDNGYLERLTRSGLSRAYTFF